MKRSVYGSLFFLVVSLLFFSSASVELIGSYNNGTGPLKESYFLNEKISGKINVSIVDEDFDSNITSNQGGAISLEKFLEDNGANYSCFPSSCSPTYSSGNGEILKSLNVDLEPSYIGFVLQGENVGVNQVSFDLKSNFPKSKIKPLKINFFEQEDYEYSVSSEEFSEKDYGCFEGEFLNEGPLIAGSSEYCELINSTETNSFFVGAKVSGSDDKDLVMRVYLESGGGNLGECSYNPNDFEGCVIEEETGETFEKGTYQFCVSSKDGESTNYKVYEETSGDLCGFVKGNNPLESVKDYSIFSSFAKYEDFSKLNNADFDFENLASLADYYIEEVYSRDCSESCVLPLSVSGISQTFELFDLNIIYTKSGEAYSEDKIYDLTSLLAKVSYEGELDLALLDFEVLRKGDFSLFLGDEKIFEDEVEIIAAPVIEGVSPKRVPAGVPINFSAFVDYLPNKTLTYYWDFGDGKTYSGEENYAIHTYSEIKNYTLSLEVSDFDKSSKKEFVITSVSPKDYLNYSFNLRRQGVDKMKEEINKAPLFYRDVLKSSLDLDNLESDLNRLESRFEIVSLDEEYLEIAKELYLLDIPLNIFTNQEFGFSFLTSSLDIFPEVISKFAGGSSEGGDYSNAILLWMNEFIDSNIDTRSYFVEYENGLSEGIFRYYKIDLTSFYSRESYFVLNKPFEEVYFKESYGEKKVDDKTLITIESGESKTFEFYTKDSGEVSFFVSPRLSSLVLEEQLDQDCNYNDICEENLGENSKVCRADCAPKGQIIFYVILVIIIFLVFYTLLQIWYKKKYENYLFEDKKQLYNLLMYISNARARGVDDSKIRKDLKAQGWNGERINYAIRKSLGKTTGMIEIIPIEKVLAYFRNRKAVKNTTLVSQQKTRNINKFKRMRRFR